MNKEFNSKRYDGSEAITNLAELRVDILVSWVGGGKSVLDVGCGDGALASVLATKGNKVSGIEISTNAVKEAKGKGIRIFDVNLNDDDWAASIGQRFDVVVAGEIIEHIFDTDNFLRNIHEVLLPKGNLILSTPNVASLGRRLMLLFGINPLLEATARKHDAGHIRYFTKKTLFELLRENSFHISDFRSDLVNFSGSGYLSSKSLARICPTIGRSLIVKAVKV